MSKHDSSLSKEQYNLLKSFKKQITQPHTSSIAKPSEPKVADAEQQQEDDLALFRQANARRSKNGRRQYCKNRTHCQEKNQMPKRWPNVQQL